ncbi:MAG: cbb3-type cytochrome oxidase assembly protein CcoS [Bacteriovoracaceae bacterium]|nr:cbb3-type cytochrome oxidase assembly protein CcoS [Bacteriovoracaceae bacterium]
MEILIILMPLALGMGALFVFLFLWAVKRGQYDDVETPKYRMLLDETIGPMDPKKGKEI